MQQIISGVQQIGIGVTDVKAAWKWYRENLGFDIPVVDAPGTAERMLPYTGGKPQDRHAVIALNIQGGGGLEVWQYLTRTPEAAKFTVQLGDLGIFISKVKSNNVEASFLKHKKEGVKLLSELVKDPAGNLHYYLEDPYSNVFEIVQEQSVFKETEDLNGGVYGAVIGVTDIEKSKKFYAEVLGYDKVIFEETSVFAEFAGLARGNAKYTRALLTHNKARRGPFSQLLGNSQIELVQLHDEVPKKIYENRFWGDLGYIQICYDVSNMGDIKDHCEKNGHPFTVDSNPEIYENGGEIFGMGDAAGHFTYIEDPDGTLIEFVETHKLPILKKIGWYLNLKKRNPEKQLPNWMLKTLAWNRVK